MHSFARLRGLIPSTRTIAAISTRPIRLFARPLPSFSSYPRRPFTSSPLIMAAIAVHSTLKPGPPIPFVPREEGAISWYACGPTVVCTENYNSILDFPLTFRSTTSATWVMPVTMSPQILFAASLCTTSTTRSTLWYVLLR